ncbi:TraB/TrbI/VirB10 family type IV secretion system protein [Ralstonia sp. 121560039-2]|jgi:hypothetical protein
MNHQDAFLMARREVRKALVVPAAYLCVLATVLSGLVAPSLASGADVQTDKRTIASGERFKCVLETPLRSSAISPDTVVACLVLEDVNSFFSKSKVIPRQSKVVGSVENGRIVWFSWSTPSGLLVQLDRIAPGALVSTLPKNLSSELQVVATRDIQLEFPANAKP